MEKLDWDTEKENAMKMGLVMDTLVEKALGYVIKVNPFETVIEK